MRGKGSAGMRYTDSWSSAHYAGVLLISYTVYGIQYTVNSTHYTIFSVRYTVYGAQ